MEFQNAFSNPFPNAFLAGCLFHMKQAIRKNIQTKGLLILYNNQLDFNFFIKMVYALVYVPSDNVILACETVLGPFFSEHEDDEGWNECTEELDDFLNYIERTWIGKVNPRSGQRKDPLFPIDTWNKHDDVLAGQQLTNNFFESFNHGFALSVESRPSLLNIIQAFQRKDSWSEQIL